MAVKKRSGFTLIEIMVVVAIMGLFIIIGTPNYIEYNRRYELLNTAKELRSLFWEAQTRSLAPSEKIDKYQISLRKDQPIIKALGYTGSDVGTEVRSVIMGKNVFIEEVYLDGAPIAGNELVVFETKEKKSGKMVFEPTGDRLRILVSSRVTDAYKYSVNLDKNLNIIGFEKVNP